MAASLGVWLRRRLSNFFVRPAPVLKCPGAPDAPVRLRPVPHWRRGAVINYSSLSNKTMILRRDRLSAAHGFQMFWSELMRLGALAGLLVLAVALAAVITAALDIVISLL
jgi:hypothetical protein